MNDLSLDVRESEAIEAFHLSFMRVMQTRMSHARYILKGGGNLRYFYGSHRYSRDLDFDTEDEQPWHLEESVDKTLAAPALKLVLQAQGLEVKAISKPKQTATTQRWKVLLAGSALGSGEVWTKVEFSRREIDERWAAETFRRRSALKGFTTPVAAHYLPAAAIEQKVLALAERVSTKPRDIFDLGLLLTTFSHDAASTELTPEAVGQAIERALSVTPEDYEAQVIPYLDLDIRQFYAGPKAWESLQTLVVERLMELQAKAVAKSTPASREL